MSLPRIWPSSPPAGVRVLWILGLVASLSPPRTARADDPGRADGVVFSGRVVELETGRPVAGAAVIVARSIRGKDPSTPLPWPAESTISTDADGRFDLRFPPDQVAEPQLCLELRIRHPGFVHRKSNKVALADLVHRQANGEAPFFATIKLERGVEYTARVVIPGDKPAAGIPYWFENWAWRDNRSEDFIDDHGGQTDDEGRIHQTMPRSHSVALWLGPPQTARARFPYAPFQHFWGTDEPSKHPDVWAPTDLGRIVLARGVRLPGRVVDTQGRPIAGQTIKAYPVRGRDEHTATTEADGSFSLGPLRPANYLIYGEGQDQSGGVSLDAPPLRRPIRVIQPVRVYLGGDAHSSSLVLHEMPSVEVEVRFVDSKGKPARGGPTKLWGLIPNAQGQADPFGDITKVGSGLASQINDPEPEDTADRIDWGLEDWPDAEGRIVFPAPKGLRAATLDAFPPDETVAYKTRKQPNGPLQFWGGGRLGDLEESRQITIVRYRSPTVVVSVESEDGKLPDDVQVNAGFTYKGGSFGDSFVRQPDGRYRGRSLMPDHEYSIYAGTREYIPRKIHHINLPEGGSAEFTVTLRKRPEPPRWGQPAPSFVVQTLDERTLSLGALRGKIVLLHFWMPIFGMQGAPSLKAVHERFSKDDRLVMLGLCLDHDREAATRIIQANGVAWPQAALRDGGNDAIAIDYGAQHPYKAFLIGPDGKLLDANLEGPGLEKAVAEALNRR
jgi:hypothetical protein